MKPLDDEIEKKIYLNVKKPATSENKFLRLLEGGGGIFTKPQLPL